MPWTMNVATPDLASFINRLEKFDKDVSKELKQEMRKASGRIANNAPLVKFLTIHPHAGSKCDDYPHATHYKND